MNTGVMLLIIFGVFLLAVSVGLFFYVIVRRKGARLDDLSVKENSSLREYHSVMKKGMEFIDEYPHERVEIESYDHLRLVAAEYCCENARGTMILFHGYRSSAKRDFSCAVKMYLNCRLNVVLADQRCHGESEGKLITFGVRERRDVLSWIEYVRERFGADEPIFLGGLSMGASTIMMAAELDLPKNVKGMVPDCGFTSPADIIGTVSSRDFHVPAAISLPLLEWVCRLVGKFSLYECSTVNALSKAENIPIFFIHGKNDGFVPYEMSIKSYEAAAGKKYIYLVEGADHGCSYLLDPKGLSARISDFIDWCFKNEKTDDAVEV